MTSINTDLTNKMSFFDFLVKHFPSWSLTINLDHIDEKGVHLSIHPLNAYGLAIKCLVDKDSKVTNVMIDDDYGN